MLREGKMISNEINFLSLRLGACARPRRAEPAPGDDERVVLRPRGAKPGAAEHRPLFHIALKSELGALGQGRVRIPAPTPTPGASPYLLFVGSFTPGRDPRVTAACRSPALFMT